VRFDQETIIHDANTAPQIRCELCDAGFRRENGYHWGCSCPDLDAQLCHTPCDRLFAVRVSDTEWMAYVDGAPLRKKSSDPRLFASARAAYEATFHAAPKLWHDHPEDGRWDRPRPQPRAGTTTALVLEILDIPRDFPWMTADDIVQVAKDRGTPVKARTVAAALANLERGGADAVEVNRTRMPLRYRRGPRKFQQPGPKLSDEMLHVLRAIKNSSQWSIHGSLGTRRALLRRGLVNEIRDEEGRICYEISEAGTGLLEES